MASQFKIEQRIKDIAFEILKDTPRQEILQKIAESCEISQRTFDSDYVKAQEYLRSKIVNKSAVERSIDLLQAATPEAIQVLRDAMKAKGEDGFPNKVAVESAGKILGKGIPEKLEIETTSKPPLLDVLEKYVGKDE